MAVTYRPLEHVTVRGGSNTGNQLAGAGSPGQDLANGRCALLVVVASFASGRGGFGAVEAPPGTVPGEAGLTYRAWAAAG